MGEAGSPSAGSAASPGARRQRAAGRAPELRGSVPGSGPLTRPSSRRAVGGQHRPGGERGRQRQRGGGGGRLLPRASRAGGSAPRCPRRPPPGEAVQVLGAPSRSPLLLAAARPVPAAAAAAVRKAAAGMVGSPARSRRCGQGARPAVGQLRNLQPEDPSFCSLLLSGSFL